MPEPSACDLCGRRVERHSSYVVRIEVFADPSFPPMTAAEVESADFSQALAELVSEVGDLSEEDLQDDVHRRFEYRLCPACQRRFLANPLGKPRGVRTGTN